MLPIIFRQAVESYQGKNQTNWFTQLYAFNSRTPWDLRHFGNPKNENLLRSPKFYGENEFPVKMRMSQLITEILSFFCFHKNFMTNISFQIAKNWAGYNFFGDMSEFGLLHRFQKWSNFWKSIIQQLTYEQYAV